MIDTRIQQLLKKEIPSSEAGFGLVEVLVAMVIAGIMFAGVASSMRMALVTYDRTEITEAAFDLAVSQVELYSAKNTAGLDNGDDLTESAVTYPGLTQTTFTRVTNVTVNSDSSRTVDVTVTSNNPRYDVSQVYSVTFALWE